MRGEVGEKPASKATETLGHVSSAWPSVTRMVALLPDDLEWAPKSIDIQSRREERLNRQRRIESCPTLSEARRTNDVHLHRGNAP